MLIAQLCSHTLSPVLYPLLAKVLCVSHRLSRTARSQALIRYVSSISIFALQSVVRVLLSRSESQSVFIRRSSRRAMMSRITVAMMLESSGQHAAHFRQCCAPLPSHRAQSSPQSRVTLHRHDTQKRKELVVRCSFPSLLRFDPTGG